MIAITLDLCFKGLSYRKIADHLSQFYEIPVNHATAYRWVKKYTEILESYVSTLEPQLGNVWHSDEMKIKVKGDWRWLWNVMDKKTRFQLASEISKTRKIEDAEAAFRKSKKTAKRKPKLVITDGLHAYRGAFKSEFHDPKFSIRYAIHSGFGLNSILERMQGNIRGRERATRGLKINETPFFEGHRIYYNFIKPHEGLNWLTPAEVAGIGVEGWMDLLKASTMKNKYK